MALTPGSLGRRYLPFIAVAAVQVLLVAIAPSKPGASGGALSAGSTGSASGVGSGAASGETGANGTGGSGAGAGGVSGVGGTGGVSGLGSGSEGPGATLPGGAPVSGANGDLSHCDKNGREIGPTYYMPLCKPVWHGGNNGGSTMTGVYADHIDFVVYRSQSNPQVDAILKTQDLAATTEDNCEEYRAFTAELNKRWELYGRHFVSRDGPGSNKGSAAQSSCHFPYFAGQCSLTPPDLPCERREADIITAMKPAFVLAATAADSFYDELTKNHILVIGSGGTGAPEPGSYFTDAAPYFWDVFMDGSRWAHMAAEYWCKKLADKPVKWAGTEVLHPDNNPLGPVPKRHLGITYPATNGDPVAAISAKEFIKLISGGMCGSSSENVVEYPYQSDINTATQQSVTTVAAMKKDHITTVIHFGDPIAPVFFSNTADQQNFHPEILLGGTGLLDYDKLARLYNPNVWRHAFGLSNLQLQPPFEQSDAANAWRDAGYSGLPDKTANLGWVYFSLMGTMTQNAGPNLTVGNIRQGMFTAPPRGGWVESHGDPHYPLIVFRPPDDYTGINDAREVWWCNSAISSLDGQPRAYIQVDNGHRYDLGQWPSGDPKVFDTTCA